MMRNGRSIYWVIGLSFLILLFNSLIVSGQTAPPVTGGIKEIKDVPVSSVTNGVWLKGDLHVHSNHSKDNKASHTHPLSKIFAYADSVGMGFICITDHDNHVVGDVEHNTWADPAFKSSSLLLLYGAEWTTTRGHGNTFSARPYDHKRLFDVRDQRDVVIGKVKDELGVHLSANHPIGKDNFGFSYDLVESIEVWNSAKWSKNENAIMIWDDMLSSGRKLTARGGSDAHIRMAYSYIGTPTTWVFAKARTSQDVVDALTNGRVSISANPYAPRVEFYADLDDDGKMDMMMGDNAKAKGKPVKFRVLITGNTIPDSTYTIEVVKGTSTGLKDGKEFKTYQCPGKQAVIEFVDTPAVNARTYFRVTVKGPGTPFPAVPHAMELSENMVGLSNPIYFNFDPDF
jgi:hypothetical protein